MLYTPQVLEPLKDEELERIRAVHGAAHRGEYFWWGNAETHQVYLGDGMHSVMGFARWGMKGAQPVFWNEKGTYQQVKDIYEPEVMPDWVHGTKPAPHRHDFKRLRHPDAEALRLSWVHREALLKEVLWLRHWTPTPENIAKLPVPVRAYVERAESAPGGLTAMLERQVNVLKQQVAALEVERSMLRAALHRDDSGLLNALWDTALILDERAERMKGIRIDGWTLDDARVEMERLVAVVLNRLDCALHDHAHLRLAAENWKGFDLEANAPCATCRGFHSSRLHGEGPRGDWFIARHDEVKDAAWPLLDMLFKRDGKLPKEAAALAKAMHWWEWRPDQHRGAERPMTERAAHREAYLSQRFASKEFCETPAWWDTWRRERDDRLAAQGKTMSPTLPASVT